MKLLYKYDLNIVIYCVMLLTQLEDDGGGGGGCGSVVKVVD